jgi:DNA-binding XRE family transcriptional regulator
MTEPRASRDQAGHTQEQAADLIQVARRTWQDWERGIAPIPPAMLLLYRHLAGLERIPFQRCR